MNEYKRVERMLYNYKMLQISIKNMEEEIKFIEGETGVGGIDYGEPATSKTNKNSSITESTALGKLEEKEYLEQQIERHKRDLEKIDRTMKGLTDTQQKVIEHKYIHGKQWWEVAGVVCYSERWCKEIRTQAINKLVVGIYGTKPE